jgi:hypothetical protein
LRVDVAERPALPPAFRVVPRFALFGRAVDFRTVVRFDPDRGPDRVLAMTSDFAKSMPAGILRRGVPGLPGAGPTRRAGAALWDDGRIG